MKKAHHQKPAVIPEGYLQTASATHDQARFHNLPFHHGHITDAKTSHGYYPGSVFVSVRQVKQQVLQGGNTQLGELFCQGVSYALELGDRYVIQ